MKKIPSLFKRDYEGTRLVYPEVVEGCEWVIAGEGFATAKLDGTACMVRSGALYKRYDAKQGRTPPAGWEPCEDAPNAKTGHWPGWLPVSESKEDKWHREAFGAARGNLPDGTYELVGPKIQGNPEGFSSHCLILHGNFPLPESPRDFDGIKEFLDSFRMPGDGRQIEGIVWWRSYDCDCDKAKIKRKDFGLKWPA